ncbi:hypothetical protein [Nocardioides humi]|uniref:hypothetical protein n=1 Tax=Nocardioides humi TaxID=449461 RepID=UPI001127825F|nr:hypothetical protein [Nocardioides humi]
MKRPVPTTLALTTLTLAIASALVSATNPPAAALADTTPPVITVDVRSSDGQGAWIGWYKDAVSAMLRATDDDGIARLSYQLTGAQTGEGSLAGPLLPVTISAEGLTTIAITATDTAGNTATRSYGVGIDRTAPTATSNFVGGVPRNDNRTIDYSCTDPGDPPGAIVSCTATHDGAPFASGTRIDTSRTGRHVVVITAADRVGHTTQRTVIYDVTRYVLLSPPVIEGNPTTVKVGQPLRASGGVFEPTPDRFTYEWVIDGVVVSQENPFIPRAAHLGKRISLRAFVSDAGPGFGNQTRTTPVGDVLVQDDLRITRVPEIYTDTEPWPATARPGGVLQAGPAGFTPTPSSVTYRWYAGDEQVGTGREYTVQPADVGKTITMDAYATTRIRAIWTPPPPASAPSRSSRMSSRPRSPLRSPATPTSAAR